MNNYRHPKRKYLIDFKMIDGLNLTIEQKKIKKNCKLFNIDMSNCKSKISKRNNISIATIGFENKKHLQYEVKHNLNIDELHNISNNLMPIKIKQWILEAHKLAQVKTLENLIAN